MFQRNLKLRCSQSIDSFRGLGDCVETINGPMIHVDNGAKILAVAHLDFVMQSRCKIRRNKVFCPQLDDRLGVWTLLDLLPSLGCPNFDVLLTDSEERGCSTASEFSPGKDYNWVFEFDRAGSDVVMYDFADDDSQELLEAYGFECGYGSFTDICELEDMGVKAFNFGVGYEFQHTRRCFANLDVNLAMAKKFCTFAEDLQSTKLEHVKQERPQYAKWSQGIISNWDRQWSNSIKEADYYAQEETTLDCPSCRGECELAWNYCPECGHGLYTARNNDDSWANECDAYGGLT